MIYEAFFALLVTSALLLHPVGSPAQSSSLSDQEMHDQIQKLSRRGGVHFVEEVAPSSLDKASPDERSKRNAFWNARLPSVTPGTGSFSGAGILRGTEVVRLQGSAWVVVRVESYAMFSPSRHRGVYTEFHLTVQEILANDTSFPIGNGDIVDVDQSGGTTLEDGEKRSYFLDDEGYHLQPGHRYLMEMKFHPAGNFWTAQTNWDITSGNALPDDDISLAFYEHHKSSISKLNDAAAIQKAKIMLSEGGKP